MDERAGRGTIKRENLITFLRRSSRHRASRIALPFPFSMHVDSWYSSLVGLLSKKHAAPRNTYSSPRKIKKKERKRKLPKRKYRASPVRKAQNTRRTPSNPRARSDAKFLRVCGRTWHVGPCVSRGGPRFEGLAFVADLEAGSCIPVSIRLAAIRLARYASERNKGFNGRGDERCRWSVANNQAIQYRRKQARDLKARNDERVVYPSIIYRRYSSRDCSFFFFFVRFYLFRTI